MTQAFVGKVFTATIIGTFNDTAYTSKALTFMMSKVIGSLNKVG